MTAHVRIDSEIVLKEFVDSPFGISVNHFMDGELLSCTERPLADAVRELGVRYLRFPGGEKSDGYLWSVPPYDRSRPTFARQGKNEIPESFQRFTCEDQAEMKPEVLDFDGFIRLCRATGAKPVIVVAYDSMYKPAGEGGKAPTREELIENARRWVRYSRERGYGVKHWEIGNESYLNAYNGWARAADYARDLAEFSEVMKAEDPSILIGANGPNGAFTPGKVPGDESTPWWREVLTKSARHIDFLSIHDYPCWKWGGYDRYTTSRPDFRTTAFQAVEALNRYAGREDAHRIGIAVTEMNSADWMGHPENLGWKHVNSLGHAVVLFDILGSHASAAPLDFTMLWNTRWVHNDRDGTPELWDALDAKNRHNPTGIALSLWGKFIRSALVLVEVSGEGEEAIRAFAAVGNPVVSAGRTEPADRRSGTSLLLINKGYDPIDLSVDSFFRGGFAAADRWTFSGTGPDDLSPVLAHEGTISPVNGSVSLRLPPVSITVLSD